MAERIVDRPGLPTPGEESAWSALRERVSITLRPLGAPTPIGFLGLAAASLAPLVAALGRTVLPLGRRLKGGVALRGSLLEQVGEVVHEPGVRQQL